MTFREWQRQQLEEHLEDWLEIGRANPWIGTAEDPEFTERSFYVCGDLDHLAAKLEHGNWCLGQAFVLQDLCFINQVNGGDEWLVIRGDVAFESYTYRSDIGTAASRARLRRFVRRIADATDEELEELEYGKDRLPPISPRYAAYCRGDSV